MHSLRNVESRRMLSKDIKFCDTGPIATGRSLILISREKNRSAAGVSASGSGKKSVLTGAK